MRCNIVCGAQDEIAFAEEDMGNGQVFGVKRAAIPQDDVEVERAAAPSLPTAAAEVGFDCLEFAQQLLRWERRRDQRRAIGIAARRWSDRRGGINGRSGHQPDVCLLDRLQGRPQHGARGAEAVMPPVGAKGDQIMVALRHDGGGIFLRLIPQIRQPHCDKAFP